jgi:hypothetical protein
VPEWDAEVAIDDVLVRALLAEQFPELDAASARLLGEGWDNSVWVVEETWAFRFPRRLIAIPGVERELAVLPRLARLLTVPIPEPRFVGVPGERFPWPFFGAPLLAGREAAEADLDDEAREELSWAVSCACCTISRSTSTFPWIRTVEPTCPFGSSALARVSQTPRGSGAEATESRRSSMRLHGCLHPGPRWSFTETFTSATSSWTPGGLRP